jgi:hypothetical protein
MTGKKRNVIEFPRPSTANYSPGSVPAQLVVAENGVPPAGCYLCTWGYLNGQYVLRFMSAACLVHFRVPRAGAVTADILRGPRG